MFVPIKARKDLICKHCGSIVPTANYYEQYQGDYHLECIWDKLIGNKKSNSYELARDFFLSLQKYIGNWPNVNFDTENDYVFDLELVKHNDRINGVK